MAMTKAHILVQDLIVMKADPSADAAALDRLAAWALRYAPIAAADPPDGLVIDVTGTTHLHGGEAAMLDDMVVRLADSGCTVRAAVADSWDGARAFARFVATSGKPAVVVPPEESAMAVLDLPVEALRLPPEMAADLRALGFTRISELAGKPRAPLTAFRSCAGVLPRPGDGPGEPANRSGALARPCRSPPQFRRAHRRRGDDRPLHRQAHSRALRGAGGQGDRRSPARPAVPPRRQPH
jgi:nucleotidyltransferase/DNA polymerase involved in DNA repair